MEQSRAAGDHARLNLVAFGDAIADLLLPVTCLVCGREISRDNGLACDPCWTRIGMIPDPQCQRCGHPTHGRRCRQCDAFPPYVRALRSACYANTPATRRLLYALKYDGWTRVARGMAQRMSRIRWPEDVREERTALVPVPLARKRLRERGYNQSEVLARALAALWRVPVWDDVLRRARETTTQTRLTPGDRSMNVRGAFEVVPAAQNLLNGAHVVLVDDVLTTGATVNACAAALHAGGARVISIVTFARAPATGDRA